LASNSGAAFNLATGKTIFLTLFGFLVILILLWWSTRITSSPWAVALGFVIGGILGNEIDRVFRASSPLQGRVIDWIELPHWPIFNLADTSIVIGAGLIVILNMRGIKPITHDRRA
jgi:signal peptidase II